MPVCPAALEPTAEPTGIVKGAILRVARPARDGKLPYNANNIYEL